MYRASILGAAHLSQVESGGGDSMGYVSNPGGR